MLKALGLRAGITIKITPQIKRMPRKQVTMLTLTKRRQPLIRNIIKIQTQKARPKKAASHDQYRNQSEKIKEDARKQYSANPEPKKRAARKQYSANPEPKKRVARKQYSANSRPKKRAAHKQ